MPKSYRLEGQRFGYLEVMGLSDQRKWKQLTWECKCVCGNLTLVESRKLRTGHTKSCGCKKGEMSAAANITHGMSGGSNKAAEYRIWGEMIQRCTNPKSNRYYTHGGRGIKVCERWRKFENFLEDMGLRPEKGLSLERRNNDGDYEPSNCFWATKKQQARNKRNTIRLTIGGVTKAMRDWAEETGAHPSAIIARLRAGVAPELAIQKR